MVKYDGKDRMVSEDPFWKEVLGKTCFRCGRVINAAEVAGAITFYRSPDAPFLFRVFKPKPTKAEVVSESDPDPEPKPLQYEQNLYSHSWCLSKR